MQAIRLGEKKKNKRDALDVLSQIAELKIKNKDKLDKNPTLSDVVAILADLIEQVSALSLVVQEIVGND